MSALNRQIRFWRWQLYFKGAFTTDDIDELESHLRDEIDYLLRLGISEEEAFKQAVQRLGDADFLKAEYMKVNFFIAWGKRALLSMALVLSIFILFAQCSH